MTKNIVKVFEQFIESENLRNQKLLLMVSGGVDSVVLLDVAAKVVKPENLAVFHLNHNSREDSDFDEIFVQNMCSKIGVQFYAEKLDPNTGKKSPNQESQWRKIRKTLAEKVVAEFRAARILTAHHATDLVETMIFRLTKGAGPSGLSPFDISTKPFWRVPKQDLLNYADDEGLDWREDNTNMNTKFDRNLIRQQVLPALRQITPNLEQVFVRETQIFGQVSDFLGSAVSSPCWGELEGGWLPKALKQKSISLKKFLSLTPILQTELLRKIALKSPSQSELEDCLKWLNGSPQGGSTKDLGGTNLSLKNKVIYWS